ncbi:NUDIX hydrolase [Oenococcus alcoholitolerans]|uniref:NUDIX hydrolase n=1 Tax=Oenococcus alcoholitolerans TaxID=931074 RepID=UPI003F70425B
MSDYIKDIRSKVGHMPLIMVGVGGAYFEDGKILLQHRVDTGGWGLPGGYMEYGERLEDTLKREFKEDAGLEVISYRFLKNFDQEFFEYPNGDKTQVLTPFYLIEKVADKEVDFDKEETSETAFFDFDDLPEIHFDSHKKILAYLKTLL